MNSGYEEYYQSVRAKIYQIARSGGYLSRLERYGGELDALRNYLEALVARPPDADSDPLRYPTIFPIYPGLLSSPWMDPGLFPATAALESMADAIREEWSASRRAERIHYNSALVSEGKWDVMPMYIFGEDACGALDCENPFPRTTALLRDLPGCCFGLPLADCIFSEHASKTRLAPHCSWDPFRVRLHLGIAVPAGCGIRVGEESKFWEEGKVLAFQDSYEHEVWNDSGAQRVVLIVDLWNPALSPLQQEALLALCRKSEVRRELMGTRAPAPLRQPFERAFARAEANDLLISRYWDSA